MRQGGRSGQAALLWRSMARMMSGMARTFYQLSLEFSARLACCITATMYIRCYTEPSRFGNATEVLLTALLGCIQAG